MEKDLQNVSAYENGKQIWRTNVISVCGKPSVGKSEIRYIKLKVNKLAKEASLYLYNLIKFFKLNDYTIYLPNNKDLIKNKI